MSADLQLREDPSQNDAPSLPPIKMLRCTQDPRSDDYCSSESDSDDKKDIDNAVKGAVTADDEDKGCRTPTSDEHKIPRLLECPPAPRKPPRRAYPGKRKASEPRMQFFEAVNRGQVEDLFRRFEGGFDNSSSRDVVKRRRSSCKGFVVQFR